MRFLLLLLSLAGFSTASAQGWLDGFAGPPGTDDFTSALAEWRGDLYVGGSFETVDGGRLAVGRLARWNGTMWNALDGGLCTVSNCGEVRALASDSLLYVGGEFGPSSGGAGGLAFDKVAAWDGEAWRDLDGGLQLDHPSLSGGWVDALAPTPDGLYVGGFFNRAGGQTVSNVARWTGTEWASLGDGLPFWVTDFAVRGSRVIAVGDRDEGSYPGMTVAEWDGVAWTRLLSDSTGSRLDAAVFVGDDLYVGGLFDEIGGVEARNLARWDGTAWHEVGGGVSSNVWDLSVLADGRLAVSGLFGEAGDVAVGRVAVWNGESWARLEGGVEGLSDGFGGRVDAVAAVRDGLVAAGRFESAGGIPAPNVAMWDGETRAALGTPVGGGLSARASTGSTSGVSSSTLETFACMESLDGTANPGTLSGMGSRAGSTISPSETLRSLENRASVYSLWGGVALRHGMEPRGCLSKVTTCPPSVSATQPSCKDCPTVAASSTIGVPNKNSGSHAGRATNGSLSPVRIRRSGQLICSPMATALSSQAASSPLVGSLLQAWLGGMVGHSPPSGKGLLGALTASRSFRMVS